MTSIQSFGPVSKKNTRRFVYSSTAYTLPTFESPIASAGKPAFNVWHADSLFYKVPEEYACIEIVVLFNNDKSVEFGTELMLLSGKEKKNMVELVPLAIEQRPMPGSLLKIPDNYSLVAKNLHHQEEPAIADSMIMNSDTMALPANETTNKLADQKQNPTKQSINGKSNTPIRKPGN